MAQVDFTNARIEPYTGTLGGRTNVNPTAHEKVMIYNDVSLTDSSGNAVSSGYTVTTLINQQKQLMVLYNGTFSASGTEFYILGIPNSNQICGWRVYNISFSSGDTYVFQINATLVCN